MLQYYIINLTKSFSLSFLLSFLGIFLFFLFYSHNYENRARKNACGPPRDLAKICNLHRNLPYLPSPKIGLVIYIILNLRGVLYATLGGGLGDRVFVMWNPDKADRWKGGGADSRIPELSDQRSPRSGPWSHRHTF